MTSTCPMVMWLFLKLNLLLTNDISDIWDIITSIKNLTRDKPLNPSVNLLQRTSISIACLSKSDKFIKKPRRLASGRYKGNFKQSLISNQDFHQPRKVLLSGIRFDNSKESSREYFRAEAFLMISANYEVDEHFGS